MIASSGSTSFKSRRFRAPALRCATDPRTGQSELEDEGCYVTCVGYLERATLLARELTFDAAVLDVNRHGERSYPVADALAARGIPFVFSTGYGDVELRVLYPGRPVLSKPYKPADLFAALSALIPAASSAS